MSPPSAYHSADYSPSPRSLTLPVPWDSEQIRLLHEVFTDVPSHSHLAAFERCGHFITPLSCILHTHSAQGICIHLISPIVPMLPSLRIGQV